MEVVVYIFYCLFCFGMMPYHAKAVTKSKLVILSQMGFSLFWAYLIFYDYMSNIPEGENGSVIIGLFMIYPLLCFLSQVVFFVLYYVINKMSHRFKLAYNKPFKQDK
jgi:hypothetical protein